MGGITRVEIRFDGDSKPSGHNVVLFDKSGTTFYVGDFSGFYFSGGLFQVDAAIQAGSHTIFTSAR